MQKLTTEVINKKNELKTIYVYVDDETAAILEQVDDKTRHQYIVEEHEIYLNNLRETRRHQSLDSLINNGFVFENGIHPETSVIKDEEICALYKAIDTLSPEQKALIHRVYFEEEKQVDIAAELGVCKQAINNQIERVLEKLKKFLG